MKLLITGGMGFIGSNFIRYLINKYPDYRIINLDIMSYAANPDNLRDIEGNPRYKFVKGDICDPQIVDELAKDVNVIINFAAESHVDRSILGPESFIKTDVYGTYVLLEAAKKYGHRRYVQISSVLGETPVLLRSKRSGEISLKRIDFLNKNNFDRYEAGTIDERFRFSFKPITNLISHPTNEIYEISYEGGGRIKTTGSHSVFIFADEGIIREKLVSELRENDRLVTLLALNKNCFEKEHILNLREYLEIKDGPRLQKTLLARRKVLEKVLKKPATWREIKKDNGIAYSTLKDMIKQGLILKNGPVYAITSLGRKELLQDMFNTKYRVQRKFCNLPEGIEEVKISPDLAWLFNLYLAEGHCSHTIKERKRKLKKIVITAGQKGVLEKAKNILEKEFNYFKARLRKRGDGSFQLEFGGKILHALFSQFGFVAKEKRIPGWIWWLSREHVEHLLKGFEGDAHIREDKARNFTSCSENLIINLLWLCRVKGINSRVHQRLCRNMRGLFQKRKPNDLLHDLVISAENYEEENSPWRTPHSKCIPVEPVLNFYKAACNGAEPRITHKKNKLIGKERALKMLEGFKEPLPSQLLDLVTSDIGIAKVKNVKKQKVAKTMVYDIEIKGNNRFFGGNIPILLHNTDEVYGSIEKGSFKETDPLNPSSPYAASKGAADLLVHSYWVTFRLPILITRSSNNFGPYQYPEKLVPLFITNALEDEPLPLYGDGKNVRDWIYVLDNCKAIDFVLHNGKKGEIYNIAGGNERTNLEITEIILRELGKPRDLVKFVKDRPGHDRRYSLDCQKIHQLGWRPRHNFEDAMRETIRWYVDNRWWWEKIKSGEFKRYYDMMYRRR